MSISLKRIFGRFKFSDKKLEEKVVEVITKSIEEPKPRIITRFVILERYKYRATRDGKEIWSEFSRWDIGYLYKSKIYNNKLIAEHALMQINSHGYGPGWIIERKIAEVKITT